MNSKDLSCVSLAEPVRIPVSHRDCMVCGDCNTSLMLRFVATKGGVNALFKAESLWQGYQGVLHGGMISTLLDAAMTHCLFHQGIEAVTADLQVRFLKPVSCDQMLELRAKLLGGRRNLYQLRAELGTADERFAWAHAKFVKYNKIVDFQTISPHR